MAFNPSVTGQPVIVEDEGVTLTSAVTSLNFAGAGVTATAVGNDVTVTIAGVGSGDVFGPASATDKAVVRFNSTTGKLIQNSVVTIGDTGAISDTIANASNVVALTLVQNDTTNNPKTVSLTNAGTGNTLFVDANGDTGSTASTSGAILVENTGNAGFGLNVYSNHATFAQALTFMKLDNTGATGNVLRLDNDGTGHALLVNANGNTSSSTSTGGAVNITNTSNTGAALVIFSNQAAPTGRLAIINAGNVAFSQDALRVIQNGTGNALTVAQTNVAGGGTGGAGFSIAADGGGGSTSGAHAASINLSGTGNTNASALNLTSANTATSCVQVSGVETGRGTIKVTHTGTGTDGNASALSINLAGTGTASQGIFVDATDGGTTGKLLNIRNNGTEKFVVTPDGGVRSALVISAKTQADTPYSVTAPDSNTVFTNEGTSAGVTFNLPTAVAGYVYTFIVQDADGITVTANAGDTIRANNVVSASAGTAVSTQIGSTLTLVAINATEWVATSYLGTWLIT